MKNKELTLYFRTWHILVLTVILGLIGTLVVSWGIILLNFVMMFYLPQIASKLKYNDNAQLVLGFLGLLFGQFIFIWIVLNKLINKTSFEDETRTLIKSQLPSEKYTVKPKIPKTTLENLASIPKAIWSTIKTVLVIGVIVGLVFLFLIGYSLYKDYNETINNYNETINILANNYAELLGQYGQLNYNYSLLKVYGCDPPCTIISNGNMTFTFRLVNQTIVQWYFPITTYNAYVQLPKQAPLLKLTMNTGQTFYTDDYRPFVTSKFFSNVIDDLTSGRTDRQFVDEVFNLREQLTTYSLIFENTTVYAPEVLGSTTGDCKDFGVLMASLLEAGNNNANYGMKIQFVYLDIYHPDKPQTVNHLILYITFKDGTNEFIETTGNVENPYTQIDGWYFDLY